MIGLLLCLSLGAFVTFTNPAILKTTTSMKCAEIPNAVYRCLSSPKILMQHNISTKPCDKFQSECERVQCIFRSSGWTKDGVLNKQAMSAHFTQFSIDKPDWAPAVAYIKEQCLDQELLPQGIHMECPVYDVMHCTLTAFIRKSQPNQWLSSAECQAARNYASACPTCPTACFAPTIPAGSCNACRDWPANVE